MTRHSAITTAYARLPIAITRGEGAYLFDENGKRYLDFAAGIAVTSLGHCPEEIGQALKAQIDQLWLCSNIFTIPQQEAFAQRLTSLSCMDRIFFCSSGLEAVETAIKMIRKYHFDQGQDRHEIITFERGFHGRSMACISAGGNETARRGFGPLLEGFTVAKPNDIASVEACITDKTAGILIEPIQAEGGVYPLDTDFLKALRQLADDQQLLLCFDEVQCGYGRTGDLFAYQSYGVEPDLITCAKGIGGGFPLAATLAKEAVAACITPGTHGSTYGGNPLAMAVGMAILDKMEIPGFYENIKETGRYALTKLETLAATYPQHITAIRGTGLIWGVEVTHSAKDIMMTCIDHGLIVTKTTSNTVLRLVPPLIIDKNHVDEALAVLEKVFATL